MKNIRINVKFQCYDESPPTIPSPFFVFGTAFNSPWTGERETVTNVSYLLGNLEIRPENREVVNKLRLAI
jgi:hypothetical protein